MIPRSKYCPILGARILTGFPFSVYEPSSKSIIDYAVKLNSCESVSDCALGLTHPRRTKLQHGTFLRFGHPRLIHLYDLSQ